LPVVFYWYETWYLAFRDEHRLRVFYKRVLRKIFCPKRDEVKGSEQHCIMWSFKVCTPHQILFV
jgi:predicted dithiol-disulfide oxidoreductase (DUF899 family)